MKTLTIFKAVLYVMAAVGTSYVSGMTREGGWTVPPVAIVGAVVQGVIALRGYLDRSVSNDAREEAGLPRV